MNCPYRSLVGLRHWSFSHTIMTCFSFIFKRIGCSGQQSDQHLEETKVFLTECRCCLRCPSAVAASGFFSPHAGGRNDSPCGRKFEATSQSSCMRMTPIPTLDVSAPITNIWPRSGNASVGVDGIVVVRTVVLLG
ncbi:hypothetical protein GW17_00060011 [Ensete ventricosum]|nr:hypothetical protein GW17_00060011 [Ensete ventricosum]